MEKGRRMHSHPAAFCFSEAMPATSAMSGLTTSLSSPLSKRL
jgi:hypothetical protein